MTLPQSAEASQSARGEARVAVLIPLRSLHDGKHRLADALSPAARAQTIRSMAETVVSAAHELPVLIVHDSSEVADWALARGATELRPDRPGLNFAVASGCELLRARGFDKVIVAHADLPAAVDLRVAITDAPIAIIADRHGDGTNVLCIDLDLEFTFAYGPGSFEAHRTISRALGIEPLVLDSPDLAWDVDYPSDLDGLPGITHERAHDQPSNT